MKSPGHGTDAQRLRHRANEARYETKKRDKGSAIVCPWETPGTRLAQRGAPSGPESVPNQRGDSIVIPAVDNYLLRLEELEVPLRKIFPKAEATEFAVPLLAFQYSSRHGADLVLIPTSPRGG